MKGEFTLHGARYGEATMLYEVLFADTDYKALIAADNVEDAVAVAKIISKNEVLGVARREGALILGRDILARPSAPTTDGNSASASTTDAPDPHPEECSTYDGAPCSCGPVDPSSLDNCPSCGGPPDNGNDREVPPAAYNCSRCQSAEPVGPSSEGRKP